MYQYAFNGFLFSQRQTGVMRYAREILQELDLLVNTGEYKLIVPKYAESVPKLNNIEIIRYGAIRGNLWEQIDFPKYLIKHNLESVNFNNTFPLIRPGIVAIHDIAYKKHPEFGSSVHGKISNIYHRILFRIAAHKKMPIITVSHFSKFQLIDEYHIDPSRITVIGSSWQQFNNIGTDDTIIKRYNLGEKEYFFSLGSLSKMKNTKWIFEVAKKNTDNIFVLAGAKALATKESFEKLPNVKLVGFISDAQVKSLIQHCKAFIYPSIYDGFGLPPLEALSQNAKVICSYAACLPEVYGNSVHYIDPYNTDINIEQVLAQPVDGPEIVLNKYSWKKSAKQLYELLQKSKKI